MNFLDRIFDHLTTQPARTAIEEVHGRRIERFDGAALSDLAARTRAYLAGIGVGPGDVVGLLAPNSARWVGADLGIVSSGATVVPLYDRQDPRELAKMLDNAHPKAILAATKELAEAISSAYDGTCPVATFDEVFAADPAGDPGRREVPEDHTVAMIYTSGTSGTPKGVMLTRANFDFMIPKTIDRLETVVGRRDEPDRVFHFLPFCFAAARLMLWTQLARPNPLLISTDLKNLVEEMGTARPNYFLTVPAVLERIRHGVGAKVRERGGLALRLFDGGFRAYRRAQRGTAGLLDRITLALSKALVYDAIKKQVGPALDFLISGSAPLSEETQAWFGLLGIPVYQAYGLTETTGIVTLDDPARTVPGRVGHAIDGVELKVTDEGELLVRGPNLFAGYHDMPDETRAALDEDGWFHTGDQVDLEEGNLRIIGRIKNLIIPESGHNIAPEPLEERFRALCPQAEQAVLVGHGKPALALLVTGDVAPETVAAAVERFNQDVPHYKKIRHFLVLDEPFTPENGLLTANQKLRRRAIEARYAEAIDALYRGDAA